MTKLVYVLYLSLQPQNKCGFDKIRKLQKEFVITNMLSKQGDYRTKTTSF